MFDWEAMHRQFAQRTLPIVQMARSYFPDWGIITEYDEMGFILHFRRREFFGGIQFSYLDLYMGHALTQACLYMHCLKLDLQRKGTTTT